VIAISETKPLPSRPNITAEWRVGDIVIWDNRCSYHKAAGDYPPEEDRIHWRVSIKEYGSQIKPD
jgi:taurine dioxygenase